MIHIDHKSKIQDAIDKYNQLYQKQKRIDEILRLHRHNHNFGYNRYCVKCGMLELAYLMDRDKKLCTGNKETENMETD